MQLEFLLILFPLIKQEYLDRFRDHNEFWYVSRDADESERGTRKKDDKWWLPTVKVPPNGLSDMSRKWLQHLKELVNQVLKAAMAINANVLMEMETPEAYIESLPKVGSRNKISFIFTIIACTYYYFDTMLVMRFHTGVRSSSSDIFRACQ